MAAALKAPVRARWTLEEIMSSERRRKVIRAHPELKNGSMKAKMVHQSRNNPSRIKRTGSVSHESVVVAGIKLGRITVVTRRLYIWCIAVFPQCSVSQKFLDTGNELELVKIVLLQRVIPILASLCFLSDAGLFVHYNTDGDGTIMQRNEPSPTTHICR